MTYEEIEVELADFEGDVYFVSILDEFVWDEKDKKVVGYHEQSTKENPLVVLRCEPLEVSGGLKNYLDKNEVIDTDVLIFCLNETYMPKAPGNWVLLKVIRKVNKKKNETRRIDSI